MNAPRKSETAVRSHKKRCLKKKMKGGAFKMHSELRANFQIVPTSSPNIRGYIQIIQTILFFFFK